VQLVLAGMNVRVADFIVRDIERIRAKWEEFVATRVPAAESLGSLELRDQRTAMLQEGDSLRESPCIAYRE